MMLEARSPRKTSGVSPAEWRLQALVAVYNILPALVVALAVAFLSLAAAAPTGLFSLFIGGVIVVFILGYAGLCLVIAIALCGRKGGARFAALSVFLFYLLLHMWTATVKRPGPRPTPTYLRGHSAYFLPMWVIGTGVVVDAALRLLPWLNTLAIAHLAFRWRQFSQSAKQIQ